MMKKTFKIYEQEIESLKKELQIEKQRNEALKSKSENELIQTIVSFLPQKSSFSLSYPIAPLIHPHCGTLASQDDLDSWFETNEESSCPYCREPIEDYQRAFIPYNFWTPEIIQKLVQYPKILLEFEYDTKMLFEFFVEGKSQSELLLHIAAVRIQQGEITILRDFIKHYLSSHESQAVLDKLLKKLLSLNPLTQQTIDALSKNALENSLVVDTQSNWQLIECLFEEICNKGLLAPELIEQWHGALHKSKALPQGGSLQIMLAWCSSKTREVEALVSKNPRIISEWYQKGQIGFINRVMQFPQRWLKNMLAPTDSDTNTPMHWAIIRAQDSAAIKNLLFINQLNPDLLFEKNQSGCSPVDLLIQHKKWYLLSAVMTMIKSNRSQSCDKLIKACETLFLELYRGGLTEAPLVLELWCKLTLQMPFLELYQSLLTHDFKKLKTLTVKEKTISLVQVQWILKHYPKSIDLQSIEYLMQEIQLDLTSLYNLWPAILTLNDLSLNEYFIKLLKTTPSKLKTRLNIAEVASAIECHLHTESLIAPDLMRRLQAETDYPELLEYLINHLLQSGQTSALVTLYYEEYKNKSTRQLLEGLFKEKIIPMAHKNSSFAMDFCNLSYSHESSWLWKKCLSDGFINEQTLKYLNEQAKENSFEVEVSKRQYPMLKALVSRLIPLDCPDILGKLLLMCCQSGYQPLVNQLLSAKNIHFYKDPEANHPIHFAALNNWPQVLKLVLDRQPESILLLNQQQQTAFDHVINKEHYDCMEVFVRYPFIKTITMKLKNSYSAILVCAAYNQKEDLALAVLKHDPQLNWGIEGACAIHYACEHGMVRLIEKLVESDHHQIFMEHSVLKQLRPMDLVIYNFNWNCIKPLLSIKADDLIPQVFNEYIKSIPLICDMGNLEGLAALLDSLSCFLKLNIGARKSESCVNLIQSLWQLGAGVDQLFCLLSHPVFYFELLGHSTLLKQGLDSNKLGEHCDRVLIQLRESVDFLHNLAKIYTLEQLPFNAINKLCLRTSGWLKNPFLAKLFGEHSSFKDNENLIPEQFNFLVPVHPEQLDTKSIKSYMAHAILVFHMQPNDKKKAFRYTLFESCMKLLDTVERVSVKQELCHLYLTQPLFKVHLNNTLFVEPDYVARIKQVQKQLSQQSEHSFIHQ